VTGLQFVAAIVNSLAWPTAVVVAVSLLRRELIGTFDRMQTLEFPGGKATFATLVSVEKAVAAAGASDDGTSARQEVTEFSLVEALTSAAPGQAVIDAWGLLEYQLNVASDRVAPDQPHGWPQVAHNLETWDKWPLLRPAVMELRRLRDYTVWSNRPPSTADATRYVSVAHDLATTLRTSFMPEADDDSRKDSGGVK
jgi:hypothetical protein